MAKTWDQCLKDVENFYDVIKWNSILYKDFNESQQSKLEAILANGIFYITGVNCYYTGYISEKALELRKLKKPITKEHRYPRKILTKELLNLNYDEITIEHFCIMFKDKASWNLTTSQENKRLIPFQKYGIFETPEKAYEQAGIVLIKE